MSTAAALMFVALLAATLMSSLSEGQITGDSEQESS